MFALVFRHCIRARSAAALLTLVLATALVGCDDGGPQANPGPPPPPSVVVAPVQRIPISPSIEYVGQTVAVDTVDLRARVEGFLVRRAFTEGEDVAEGALLFGLEREPFQAAVEAAQAQVVQTRAEVVRTGRDLERVRTLYAQGNVSQRSLDQAISDQQQSEARLRQNEAELRQAQIDLGYTEITAPFAGRIGRAQYSVGQWVGPESGVLATLVKLEPIYVVFNVSERSYLDYRSKVEAAAREGRARPEFVPRLRLANGADYPVPGVFNFVDNRVDPTTGTIAVRAEFPNPDKLLVPGLYVTVVLRSTAPQVGLMVPQAAVQEDQGGRFVLVVGEGDRVAIRRVQTGARIGVLWQVTAGVEEGERVIYEGIQKVRPGAVVAPTPQPQAQPAG